MKRMEHADIKALLSPLIDGELDPETQLAVERTIAECDKSRQLVDEAERLNDLIARDAASLAGDESSLPPGFVDAVLNQTTRAAEPKSKSYFLQWTTWSGWIAAAACLGLAVTIYVQDNTPSSDPANNDATRAANNGVNSVGNIDNRDAQDNGARLTSRSWTHNNWTSVEWSGDNSGAMVIETGEFPVINAEPNSANVDDFFGGVDLRHAHIPLNLSDDEIETLFAAAQLLDTITQADASDVPRIVVDSQMRDQLRQIVRRLPSSDRDAIRQTLQILDELADSELTLQNLMDLQFSIEDAKLPSVVRDLRNRATSRFDMDFAL